MPDDDLQNLPVERRQLDRRREHVPVPNDRRQLERRANRLEPTRVFNGVAVVIDGWPLLREGVRRLLSGLSMRVAADDAAVGVALDAVGDRLDLAVIGATRDPLPSVVKRVRSLPGPEDGVTPRILILLDRVDVVLLRELLAEGVEGVVDRAVGAQDLEAACERILSGQRVLAGGPLSVLASAGLELNDSPPPQAVDRTGGLTRKELEVLAELGRHLSNRQIAAEMHLSAATVKTHLSNIYAKLGVAGRREAVVAAVEQGLLT